MNTVLFAFAKPSDRSMVVSPRIATFIAKTLRVPLCYDERILEHKKPDVLILVNGAFAFCKHLESVAQIIRTAKRVVWVQNDYTIIPPKAVSGAVSPFRAAFRERTARGLPWIDFWTTCERNASVSELSRYINWNALTMSDTALPIDEDPTHDYPLYYGAYRVNRQRAFDRYFTRMRYVISTPSAKFAARYPRAKVVPPFPQSDFLGTLNTYALGLYLEDRRSHTEFHSPANRFYEMLSAGLPMVFEPEARRMMRHAGYKIKPFIVRSRHDVKAAMRDRLAIAQMQRSTWCTTGARDAVAERVRAAYLALRASFSHSR